MHATLNLQEETGSRRRGRYRHVQARRRSLLRRRAGCRLSRLSSRLRNAGRQRRLTRRTHRRVVSGAAQRRGCRSLRYRERLESRNNLKLALRERIKNVERHANRTNEGVTLRAGVRNRQIAQLNSERVAPLANAREINRCETESIDIRSHSAATAVHVGLVIHHDADAVSNIRLRKGAEALGKADSAADALLQLAQLVEKLHAASFSTTIPSNRPRKRSLSERLSLTSVSVR